jgi:hemerythrin
MALMQWSTSLSVHVAEIDAQHQRLVEMINDLNEAMKEGRGREIIGRIVDGLISYTATHFATEEEYFSRFGYPGSAAHALEHRAFVNRVAEFRQGFEEGRLGLSVSVMNFLGTWLREHILGSDKEYVPFLNAKGLR